MQHSPTVQYGLFPIPLTPEQQTFPHGIPQIPLAVFMVKVHTAFGEQSVAAKQKE
jgi:hypothetical protein